MTKKYATGFPAASSLNLTDNFQAVQSVLDKNATLQQVFDLFTIPNRNAMLTNLGQGGDPYIQSSTVDVVFTNPCPTAIITAFSGAGHSITLPPMNASNSLSSRGIASIFVFNTGSFAFQMKYQDGSNLQSINPQEAFLFRISPGGGANGFIVPYPTVLTLNNIAGQATLTSSNGSITITKTLQNLDFAIVLPANPTFNTIAVTDQATTQTNLGLGTAATQNVGAFFQIANNLSDGVVSTMLANLGITGKQLIATELSFSPTAANPALVNYDVSPTNVNNSRYFSFTNGVVTSIFTQITLPKNITKTSFTYQIIFEGSSNSLATVQFSAKAVLHINGTNYDIAFGTPVIMNVGTPGVINQQVTSSESTAVTPANIGTLPDVAKLEIVISRNGNADSYGGVAKVKGILIYMTQNAGNCV